MVTAAKPRVASSISAAWLADLTSVREFADGMHADHARLDVLTNNAGVMATPHTLSPQGHELQFDTDHLGPFALTGLLLAGRDPRVVTVTSVNHRQAKPSFGAGRGYSPMGAYNTTVETVRRGHSRPLRSPPPSVDTS
jgi:NAD(P)-dependent dehydrogenase (short-subunit alcohol dehydrogenase family)